MFAASTGLPVVISICVAHLAVEANKARTLPEKLRAFSRLGPKDFVPVPPALKEATTGLSMGESAEKMAKEVGISRVERPEAPGDDVDSGLVLRIAPGLLPPCPSSRGSFARRSTR